MSESGEELARRALKQALAKLDANGASVVDEPGQLIVLILGAGESRGHATPSANEASAGLEGSPPRHPSLEKFPATEVPAPSPGTKACFMEPDRVCVGSGACEMRGY
jgi:hypothetical protein